MLGVRRIVSVDIKFYQEAFFPFDKPIPYELKCGTTLNIKPITLSDSVLFVTSCNILNIDKNSTPDPEVISMSYLKFLAKRVLPYDELAKQQLVNICILCLDFSIPYVIMDDNDKPLLCNIDKEGKEILFTITQKEFDDVRKIIMYQNILNFDDSYINPELKERMDEVDELRMKNFEPPSLERRMAIITSHCGISKTEQCEMTFRSHSLLFEEVSNEVEYMCTKPAAIRNGKTDEIQWIFKRKKDKFGDYITSVEDYNKSMGGDGSVKAIHHLNSENNGSQ